MLHLQHFLVELTTFQCPVVTCWTAMQTVTNTVLLGECLQDHKGKWENGCSTLLGMMSGGRTWHTDLLFSYLATPVLYSSVHFQCWQGHNPQTVMGTGAFCFKGHRIRSLEKCFLGTWVELGKRAGFYCYSSHRAVLSTRQWVTEIQCVH